MIKYEYELYTYIKGYLAKKNIQLVQNEVSFTYQLKAIDLLAKDSNTYYLIEVKRNNISEKDYYNIKYIMYNNIFAKDTKGILVGNCRNKELMKLIEEDRYVELITIDEIYNTCFESNLKMKSNREYYDECNKYLRNFFCYISNYFFYDLFITNKGLIKITYKLEYNINI